MNRNLQKGIKIGLGIISTLSLFFCLIYATGFHNANEILGGTFLGNYSFNGNITINGKIETENWSLASLENGWVNYNSAYTSASYKKDNQGFVHIKGLVASGAGASCIFTLPTNYRPEKISLFSTVSNDAIGRVSIQTNGCVYLDLGSNAWVSLEGIYFEAYQ